jgi:hypothetical protein
MLRGSFSGQPKIAVMMMHRRDIQRRGLHEASENEPQRQYGHHHSTL